MRRLARAVPLVAAALLSAPPVLAQPGTGTLRGIVVSEADGSPVAGATVQIANGGPMTKTDSGGLFKFQVKAGTYEIRATRLGFTSESLPGLAVKAGGAKDVCAVLKPAKK